MLYIHGSGFSDVFEIFTLLFLLFIVFKIDFKKNRKYRFHIHKSRPA